MLRVTIANLEFKNPIMNASGTFSYGREYSRFFDLSLLGGIVCKTVTLKKRDGNPTPRIADSKCYMLNSIGLENPGLDFFTKEALAFLSKIQTRIIVSIAGQNANEYAELASRLDQESIDAIEINLSCPNVAHGKSKGLFAQSEDAIQDIISSVRKKTKKPIFAKLSSQVRDIALMAKICEDSGSDAITLINTVPGLLVDLEKQKPLLGNTFGGISGPALKPIVLKAIYDTYKVVNIPLIASGGIMNTKDALEAILCGATCIQIGTANFINPLIMPEIILEMEKYVQEKKIKSLDDLRGKIHET